MPQFLKRWEEASFDLLGQKIRLKVKAPLFDDAPEFLRKMTAFGRAAVNAQAAGSGGASAGIAAAESMFAAIDTKWAREVFTKCVRPVEPIVVEDEGPDSKPIQTGEELYEVANTALVLQVLHKVQRLIMLGEAEGKASSSPSTSDAVTRAEAGPGDSPATSIEPADGTAH